MRKIFFGCLLLSFGIADYGYAARKSGGKKKQSARKHKGEKPRRGKLHPLTLRVFYAPNYRFFTEEWGDSVERLEETRGDYFEAKQFFPLAGGIEGDFELYDILSVAVGGSFTYGNHDTTGAGEYGEFERNLSEVSLWSSLYLKAHGIVNIGGGIGLDIQNLSNEYVLPEDGLAQQEEVPDSSSRWYTVSAHIALRRDFFLSDLGFGVGLNAIFPVTDPFWASVTVDGKTEDVARNEAEDFTGYFSAILMPMVYVVF